MSPASVPVFNRFFSFSFYSTNACKGNLLFSASSSKTANFGPSGSINLIGGFLAPDEAGDMTLNGQSLPHLGQDAWQANQFYIPQNPYLFHDTLAKNVAFYVPSATRDAIEQACAKAGLTEWIDR